MRKIKKEDRIVKKCTRCNKPFSVHAYGYQLMQSQCRACIEGKKEVKKT